MWLSSSSDYSLLELTPRLHATWYARAHEWARLRPWAFPRSGGYLRFSTYLEKAAQPWQTDVAVFLGPVMISLITTERSAGNEYCAHITSPRKARRELIIAAAREVLDRHFHAYAAQAIYSHCPTIDGHLHRGSKALCEGVGLIASGIPECETIRGHRYEWQPYELTRDRWLYLNSEYYGRENENHTEHTAAIDAERATGAVIELR